MIIDFHTHVFPDAMAQKTVEFLKSKSMTEAFTDGTVADLSAKSKRAGVELSVALPVVTNPLSTRKINVFASKVNENTEKTGVFSFGGMHPDTPDYKGAINEAQSLGLKGVKIHPAYQQTPIDDIRFKRIIGYAQERGLIVISHGGLDIGVEGDWCSPMRAAALIDDVKPEKFVLAHLGGWQQWEDVRRYLCGKKVYFDTAFCCVDFAYRKEAAKNIRKPVLKPELFTEIVKAHGADKVLFGTDSPWGEQNAQLKFIRALPLSDTEKAAITGQNAAKLLGL